MQAHIEDLLIQLAAAIHDARTVAELGGIGSELRLVVRETRQTHDRLRHVLAEMHPNAPPGACDRLVAMEKAVTVLEARAGAN